MPFYLGLPKFFGVPQISVVVPEALLQCSVYEHLLQFGPREFAVQRQHVGGHNILQ